MSCEKIRELILTDYIDNEISDKEKIRLNIHFANCRKCKEFSETVKSTVVKPFANVEKIELPGFIWHRVKEAIIAEQQNKPGFLASLLKRLKFLFYAPKPALALSTIMALVLIAVLTTTLRFSNKQALEASRENQAEYSIYSIETPVGALSSNDAGFGTSIEDNFL